ncbi:prolyl 4-hydroxylase subunit alpha-1-like [Amphibalanus amphitrite]|uniref:prolyl 4-hydroxylase subunit alpha-1-like n=1 Tax=Amphibalanus amphitrite TaxID=1232801 RepID=UPI001C90FAF7|nr:prolyl 4-hydroxylase subunit alpha-1-like [Amphibalanus amphitrite]
MWSALYGALVVAAVTAVCGGYSEDFFSSTSRLEQLVGQEEVVVDKLERYLEEAYHSLETVRSYVTSFREMRAGSSIHHPVEAFLMLRRLTVDWDIVEDDLRRQANQTQETLRSIGGFRADRPFPEVDDLHGAAVALIRLQDTYQLNMTQLPRGHIASFGPEPAAEFQSAQELTARDCLFIGRHAFSRGLYDAAIEWFEAALWRTEEEPEGAVTATRDEIEPLLTSTIKLHDSVLEEQGPRGEDWRTNPVPIDRRLAEQERYQPPRLAVFRPRLHQPQAEAEEEEHYQRLCRGERLRSPEEEADLSCHLTSNGSPLLLLSPLRVEVLSRQPYIVMLHQLVTETEVSQFQELAGPRLATSRHRHPDGEFVASMSRISKNAWIPDDEDPTGMLARVTRRVAASSGLKCDNDMAAEAFQVANYGIGGLYVTHTDHHMAEVPRGPHAHWETMIGDRLATWMVYLSDVPAGGATVFPRAGVTVWPERGSVAFWWNLNAAGKGDDDTRHAACPVLHGSKWVSNKWIHYNEQFRTKPCGLTPDAIHQTP